MKAHFINAIRNLLDMILAQGGQVEQVIQNAIVAVSNLDGELAAKVIASDAALDAEEIRIEEECLKTLALYQPVASDLRMVVAMLKINTALERMADFGVHIAERVQGICCHAREDGLERIDFSRMQHAALKMIRDSMEVMQCSDPVLACSVIEKDEAINQAHRDNIRLACDAIRRFPEHSGYYIDCIAVSRNLERIADLATDICEHIIYLQTGRIVRHNHG